MPFFVIRITTHLFQAVSNQRQLVACGERLFELKVASGLAFGVPALVLSVLKNTASNAAVTTLMSLPMARS
jgi:hypothetical protein